LWLTLKKINQKNQIKMKKLILPLILVICVNTLFAQKSNVSKARNKALMDEADFVGAREAIKAALVDSTTKNLAETWYVAGLIGYTENAKLYEKSLLPGVNIDKETKGKAIMESYSYFLKADSVGQIPDVKGKINQKTRRDIKPKLKEYYTDGSNLVNYGSYLFDSKKYLEAMRAFEVYTAIPLLPMMNGEIKLDSTYYKILFYQGVSASAAEMHDDAIKVFESLKDKKYETSKVFQYLFGEYQAKKDTTKMFESAKQGFENNPKDVYLIGNLINLYIASKKDKEALNYLNTAIASDPKNTQYYLVQAKLYEDLKDFDAARATYDKALIVEPKLGEAYSGIGRLYYNKAGKIWMDADSNLKDDKLIKAEKEKANLIFKEAIPFFKKAIEISPNEIEYKRNLKTLYYRLGMNAEYDAIDKEIKSMK
jgi:tetratricopeptide (TPR) repeat protein